MSSTKVRPLAPPQSQGSPAQEEMDYVQVSAVFPGGSACRGLVSVSPPVTMLIRGGDTPSHLTDHLSSIWFPGQPTPLAFCPKP